MIEEFWRALEESDTGASLADFLVNLPAGKRTAFYAARKKGLPAIIYALSCTRGRNKVLVLIDHGADADEALNFLITKIDAKDKKSNFFYGKLRNFIYALTYSVNYKNSDFTRRAITYYDGHPSTQSPFVPDHPSNVPSLTTHVVTGGDGVQARLQDFVTHKVRPRRANGPGG